MLLSKVHLNKTLERQADMKQLKGKNYAGRYKRKRQWNRDI